MKRESMSGKVFLTGGSGFLGRSIVARLLDNGFEIIALARRSNTPAHLEQAGVTLAVGDIRDQAFLTKATKSVDFIIHAAAIMSGSCEEFEATNVASTEQLLAAAVENKIKRFVYVSSVSVYPHSRMKTDPIFHEDSEYEDPRHTSFYSRSKIEAEKVVNRFKADRKLATVIIRPGAIYGPGGAYYPATLGLGLGLSKILAMGDRSSFLPLSYVENVADAIVRSLSNEKAAGETFNVIEDESVSRQMYLDLMRAKVNRNLKVLKMPLWLMKTLRLFLKTGFSLIGRKAPLSDLNLALYCTTITYSNEKYKEIFGEKPFVAFDESLERTFSWHKTQLTPRRSVGLKGIEVLIPTGKKLHVGIIGCGNIANVHIGFLQRIENVAKISIADPSEAALAAIKEKFGIDSAYTDYKALLKQEHPDVVHILAPPQFHAEIAVDCASHGCHLFVEKPLALDAADAGKIGKAVEKNGVKLCVNHNHLFDRVMVEARNVLATAALGKISYVESWYGTQFGSKPPFQPGQYWGYSLPGGLYQDYLPHAAYNFLDIMGAAEVRHVNARYLGGVQNVETDELKIFCENEKRSGMISVSMSVAPRRQYVTVYGTGGTMRIDFLNKVVFLDKEIGPLPKTVNRAISALKYGSAYRKAGIKNILSMRKVQQNLFEGTDRLIRLFYRSILVDEPSPVPFEEGMAVMRLMDSVWAQMKVNDQTTVAEKKSA